MVERNIGIECSGGLGQLPILKLQFLYSRVEAVAAFEATPVPPGWGKQMEPRRSEAEAALLDAADSLSGLTGKERHARLIPAVHDLLQELVRPGYRMVYAAQEGLHVYTPSGLWVWFCPACDGALEVLVTDTADEVLHPAAD